MFNKKSFCIDIALGAGLAVLAAVVYFCTLCPSVFPGPSASAFVVSSGITPRFGPSYPLWFALCEVLNSCFADTGTMKTLNAVSAVCAAAAVWALYSVVRMTTWLMLKVEVENYAQHLFASRLAGGVAAFVLTFALPFWIAANRCHWATFHALLLLLVVRLFLTSIQLGSNRLGYLFAFLFGIVCVEYPTLYTFTPIIAMAFFMTAHKDERLSVGVMFRMLAFFFVGLLAYIPTAWVFMSGEGAQLRGITEFGESLRVTVLDSWNVLARSLPRQGWLVILVSSSLPWVVSLSMGKRALNAEGDSALVILHLILSAVVVSVLVNSPLSPWVIVGEGRMLVLPYVLTAWMMGYLAAYFFLLPQPHWRNKEVEASAARRVLSCVLPLLLIGFSLSLPFINKKVADARPAKALAQIGQTLIDQLSGQKWIISDGSLDAQFLPVIQRDHLPVKVLSYASMSYAPLRTYVLNQIDDDGLRIRAEIGFDALLREWFLRPDEAVKDVAVMYPANAWSVAGLLPVPNVLFFSGAKSRSDINPVVLKERHLAAWDVLIPAIESGIAYDAFAPIIRHIQRQAGMVANNLGVLLEDYDLPEDAYEIYRRAREIDPANVSALMNAHNLILGGGQFSDAERVKKEMADTLQRFRLQPVQIVDLVRNYGEVRESRALASMAELSSRSGKTGLASTQLEKALALSTGEDKDSAEMRLAEIYFAQDRNQEAESILKRQLEENPNNGHALMGSVRLAAKRKNFDAARTYLGRAREAGVPAQELALQEAFLLAVQGKKDEAEALLQDLLRQDKKLLSAWEMLVNLHIAARDVNALQRTIYSLEGLDFSRGFLHAYASGHRAMLQGDAEGIARHFEQALVFQPENVRLLQFMVRLDVFLGRSDIAERRTRKLLQVDPDNRVGNFFMSNFQIQRGEYRLAAESLRRLLAKQKDPLVMNSMAWLLKETGQLDEAAAMITEALGISDSAASLWDTYGEILMEQNKLGEAVEAFRKSLSLERNYPASTMNLARVYMSQGNTEAAVTLVNSLSDIMYDLSPEHREQLRAIRKKLGID